MTHFQLKSKFKPAGDQPKAIRKLIAGLKKGMKHQTLLGVTGSGKTFTIAHIIQNVQRPTLVIAPNKTLAAQLTAEFRLLFPNAAVEYFVSYYDYYQPEAYLPTTDTYIEKEAEINEEIDRLRHAATSALMERRDVIIVASVSCIYGLGSPEAYQGISLLLKKGEKIFRDEILSQLVRMHYQRSEILDRGRFRAHGPIIEIMPPVGEVVWRIEIKDDKIKKILEFDELTRKLRQTHKELFIYPARHFIVSEPLMGEALKKIGKELEKRLKYFKKRGEFLEAERLERRTKQDLEMMREIGYCAGIENYSRYLTGRALGEPPYTLIDYFPKDFLLVIDESHVTVPQLKGMFAGDNSRKKTLIKHGFRLPSALDNRPLKFDEFEHRINQVIYTSATPGPYETKKSAQIVEQIIRPTGLIDPAIEIRPAVGQIKNLIKEISRCIKKKERVLVTTLTKKMAEDLSEYLAGVGDTTSCRLPHGFKKKIKSRYLHSEVSTLERINILEDLRKGTFDVLVGVNLLREGLDLPEVSLVAILDADKEGFLRSKTSLIQTMGRAARNVYGKVILYADEVTDSMKRAVFESGRRRKKQIAFNKCHHITPKTIKKSIKTIIDRGLRQEPAKEFIEMEKLEDIPKFISEREKEMKESAKNLEFEKAAVIRDEIVQLKKLCK